MTIDVTGSVYTCGLIDAPLNGYNPQLGSSRTTPISSCSVIISNVYMYMERSIRKWVLWISFYNIKFKSIYLP